jgi:hypothetical protein
VVDSVVARMVLLVVQMFVVAVQVAVVAQLLNI